MILLLCCVSFSCPARICFLLIRVPCTLLGDMYYPPSLRPLNLGWEAGSQETQAGNQSAKFPSTRGKHLTQVHSVSVSLSRGTFQACTTNHVSQEHHSLRTELGLSATDPDLGPYSVSHECSSHTWGCLWARGSCHFELRCFPGASDVSDKGKQASSHTVC